MANQLLRAPGAVTVGLCAMNLFLHGIGEDDEPVPVDDSLIKHPGENFGLVLTNPPFGRKSSITNGEGKTDSWGHGI